MLTYGYVEIRGRDIYGEGRYWEGDMVDIGGDRGYSVDIRGDIGGDRVIYCGYNLDIGVDILGARGARVYRGIYC